LQRLSLFPEELTQLFGDTVKGIVLDDVRIISILEDLPDDD